MTAEESTAFANTDLAVHTVEFPGLIVLMTEFLGIGDATGGRVRARMVIEVLRFYVDGGVGNPSRPFLRYFIELASLRKKSRERCIIRIIINHFYANYPIPGVTFSSTIHTAIKGYLIHFGLLLVL